MPGEEAKGSTEEKGTGHETIDVDEQIQQPGDSVELEGAEPLFEEEAMTDEQLMGPEEPEKKESPTEEPSQKKETPGAKEQEKAAEAKPEGEKKEAEKEGQEKEAEKEGAKPEEKEGEKPGEEKKPPPGYVPHEALHEERLKRQALSDEVIELRATVATLEQKVGAKEEPKEDFKVLSDEEFEELVEEDAAEAIKYQARLSAWKEKQRDKNEADREKTRQQRQEDERVISTSIAQMEAAVPGIHDREQTVNKDLSEFAVNSGLDVDFLSIMTNPATVIVPAGEDDARLLGPGAASLVQMIHTLYQGSQNSPDPAKLRAEIEAELTTTLTEKITKELIKKFKTNPDEVIAPSIGDVPGAGEIPEAKAAFVTEDDYAKLTPEQQQKALGG